MYRAVVPEWLQVPEPSLPSRPSLVLGRGLLYFLLQMKQGGTGGGRRGGAYLQGTWSLRWEVGGGGGREGSLSRAVIFLCHWQPESPESRSPYQHPGAPPPRRMC